jgi:hypothetical protein
MLQVVLPLALIASTVDMDVDSVAVGFVVDPVSFVDITIYVNELSLPMCSVVLPVSFVARPIWPYLFAKAISKAAYPLPLVGSACFKCIEFTFFSFCIWIVNSF